MDCARGLSFHFTALRYCCSCYLFCYSCYSCYFAAPAIYTDLRYYCSCYLFCFAIPAIPAILLPLLVILLPLLVILLLLLFILLLLLFCCSCYFAAPPILLLLLFRCSSYFAAPAILLLLLFILLFLLCLFVHCVLHLKLWDVWPSVLALN